MSPGILLIKTILQTLKREGETKRDIKCKEKRERVYSKNQEQQKLTVKYRYERRDT